MSGASVVVLALNGRRQTVKCSPNTTILQIIEEVCKKQGLNPHEFDIKHHNKILDTTTSFRFSGLPNNAQLELAPAAKNRQEGDVTLAVNLEDGTRITDTFSPNDTLMNILNKICPQNAHPDRNPVVIYTRREIYGKELENCTLRSLGLVGGRAMIRVLNRDPELLKQQANVSAPLPAKPVEEKPYIRKFQPVEVEESKAQAESVNHDYGVGHKMTDSEESSEVKPQKNLKNPGAVDYVRMAKEKRKSLDTPKSPDLQREKKKMTENLPSHSEPMDVEDTTKNSTFEDDFVFCGERNGMIFSQESAQSVPSEDLPDDFFELTIDDAKRILRDVKRKRQELDNQMLRTSQLRQLEETKKQLRQLNRYKRAVIRVQFPDRTVVQGTFKPTETIQDVIDFVKSYLEDQSIDFYIYSTPPKVILDKSSRLIEIGCVPGALLYFGSNGDLKQETGYLKKELRDKFTTNSVASLAAAKIRHENTRLVEDNEEEDVLIERVNDNVPVNYGASTSSDSSSTERKIVSNSADFPKWFKPL